MNLVSDPIAEPRWRPKTLGRLPLFFLLVCCAGCGSEFVKSLQELGQLRSQLLQQFHEKEIGVQIVNSTQLSISFVNSVLNDQLPVDRAKRAQATALYVKQHYAGIDRLHRILVFFVRAETRYVFAHYYSNVDMYFFDRNGARLEQGAAYDVPPNSDDRAPYADARKPSEIEHIQLSGNLNKGLALFPSFTASEASTSPRRVPSGGKVIFTFASYAPEKVFKTDVPFALIADGKIVYRSTTLNTSKTAEGGNEFLTQEIPYVQLVEFVQATRATLKLADKEYRLTDEQLNQLRELAGAEPSPHR